MEFTGYLTVVDDGEPHATFEEARAAKVAFQEWLVANPNPDINGVGITRIGKGFGIKVNLVTGSGKESVPVFQSSVPIVTEVVGVGRAFATDGQAEDEVPFLERKVVAPAKALADALKAQATFEKWLKKNSGVSVAGYGIARVPGGFALKINVTDPATRRKLPLSVAGVPTVIDLIGTVVAEKQPAAPVVIERPAAPDHTKIGRHRFLVITLNLKRDEKGEISDETLGALKRFEKETVTVVTVNTERAEAYVRASTRGLSLAFSPRTAAERLQGSLNFVFVRVDGNDRLTADGTPVLPEYLQRHVEHISGVDVKQRAVAAASPAKQPDGQGPEVIGR